MRPELGDLLVRWEVAQLPGPGPVPAGVPGVVHAVGFEVDGVRYEIRAARTGAGVPARAPFFGLYRCDPACIEVQALEGGYGESAVEITSSVGLGTLGLGTRNVLHDVVAFSGPGEAAAGVFQRLDEIVVGDVPVPEIEVSMGVAAAGSDPGDVVFNVPASFTNGRFTAELSIKDLAPGDYDVWARGCLGEQCGTASSRVSFRPTAVVLRSFTARRSGPRTVALHWRTGTEAGLLGFNVYRQRGGKRIRLNRQLIASQNATEGTYAFGDRLPEGARARYWLQAVKTDGSRAWLGSATVQ